MSDPKHIIRVSHKDLTRCDDCGRHVALEGEARHTRSRDAIAAQACPFCGASLARGRDESRPVSPAARGLGRRSSRLAAGLLVASAALTGCPEDEPVDGPKAGAQQAGAQQAGVMMTPDMDIAMPEYGVFPEPDMEIALPPYGAFPRDLGMVEPAPDMALNEAAYGAFPDDVGAPPEGGAQGGAQGGAGGGG